MAVQKGIEGVGPPREGRKGLLRKSLFPEGWSDSSVLEGPIGSHACAWQFYVMGAASHSLVVRAPC
eukprot:5398843-Pyramimonas_sp.AAC.1